MALGSKWDKLNPILIAKIYECDKDGGTSGGEEVHCPFAEADIDITLNWQSAFENMSAESKAPALLAMLQTGALQPVIAAIKGNGAGEMTASEAQQKTKDSNQFLKQFEGRTGITKLNSTQVFVGMPPVMFNVTALFRAWDDPQSEVNAPIDQLVQWSLPKELSPDGLVVASLNAAHGSGDKAAEILMPSLSPVFVAIEYKGKTYAPLVIENVGLPISSPCDSSGGFIHMKVPMKIASLTAIDAKDWKKF